jgi:PAS domain S-box-containing protein
MYTSAKGVMRPEATPAPPTELASFCANAVSHLRALFENTTDAIWLVDQERRFVAYNEFLFEIIKLTTGVEIEAGQHHPSLFPGHEEQFWNAAYDRVFAGERFLIENEYEGPYGKASVEFSLNPVWENGEVVGAAGVGRDITRQRTLDSDLERSEANYKQLFLHSPQPMWVIDVQTRTISNANRAAARL